MRLVVEAENRASARGSHGSFGPWTTLRLGDIGSVSRLALFGQLQEVLDAYLPQEIALLDVGCGSGVLLEQLVHLKRTGSYLGCDLTRRPGWKQLFSSSGLHVELIEHDAHELGCLERRFDVAVSVMAFEHFDDDVAVLRGMREVLSEDGVAIVSVPARASRLVLGKKHCFRWYSAARIRTLAQAGSFRVEEVLTHRGGLGLLWDAARVNGFRFIAKVVRAAAYASAGGRSRALLRYPGLDQLNGTFHRVWLSAGGGSIARGSASVGLALDRLLPVAEVHHVVVLRPLPLATEGEAG